MVLIDPSPSEEELAAIKAALKQAAAKLSEYLKSDEGRKDENFVPLTTAALNLYVEIDNISDAELQLAVQSGGRAVDTINEATAQLKKAIKTRKNITKSIDIIQSVVAFGAAIAAGDPNGIITSGIALTDALSSTTGSKKTSQ